jgi:hypothetical protein
MNSATLETSQENTIVGANESATPRVEYINLHRDDRDVRLLLQMSLAEILIVVVLLVSIACNVWQYFRRPDRIIIDRRNDGDYVISINEQSVANGITAGTDKPGDGDKRRLANEWATARYAIDPAQREQAVERLLRMMEPNAAAKFVAYLKRNGELERERSERWQSSWKPQLTIVDGNDPNRINLVGLRELNKVVGGVPASESSQFIFSLKLMPDKDSGRAAHNLHTGYLVLDIMDVREVASGNSGDSVLPQR